MNSDDEQTTTDTASQADDSQENQVESVENPVAEVNGTQYATVQEAVSAAKDGETVTLLQDISSYANWIYLKDGKDIAIDMNGHDLTFAGTYGIYINGGKLDLTGKGTVYAPQATATLYMVGNSTDVADYSVAHVGKDVTLKNDTFYGMGLGYIDANSHAAYGVKLTLDGKVIAPYGFTVSGTITRQTGNIPEITVNGEIESTSATDSGSFYAAGYAKYNINGKLTGVESALEIRAGILNVGENAVLTATGNFTDPMPNGNGSTLKGVALAVSQHSTNLPIEVNIAGGTFSATGKDGHALYEIDTVKGDVYSENVVVNVTGGTFTQPIFSANNKFAVSGGTFSEAVKAEYCAEDYEPTANEDGTYTVKATDYYQRLQDTIADAKTVEENKYSDQTYNALQDAVAEAGKLTEDSAKADLKTAIEKITKAKKNLKVATVKVSVSCNPGNSGILTGGGNYAEGETVTVTAKAVDGYKFTGWSNGSTDTTLTFTAADSNYELTANYVSNENKNLEIIVGEGSVNYKYENDEKGDTTSEDLKAVYPMGSRFTVTATPKDGYTFLYWINGEGRILSNSETYSFYLGYDMTVQACYKEKAEGSHVVFKDMNGRVLWSGDSKKGEVSVPELKVYDGFEFKGWVDSATKEQIADKDAKTITVEKDMTIYADYESLKGLTVTVDGIQQEQTYEYANLVKVTADESRDGKYFSGWYSDGKQVSQEREYSFYITENTNLTAEYNGNDVLEKSVLLNMDMSERTTLDNGKESVVMKVTWDIPEGYSLVQGGLIRTLNDDYKDKLTLENVDGTNVKKNVSKLASSNGTYLYTLTLATTARTKNLHAVGYVTYRNNATGEVKTVYTNLNTANGAAN